VLPQLTSFDRAGKPSGIGDRARYSDLELAPDGRRAAVAVTDAAGSDIWLVDLARGLRSRFTFDAADETTAAWSPDGSRIAFNSRAKGHFDLYVKASNGSGREEPLLIDAIDKYPTGWSPDGRFLIYVGAAAATGTDLWVLPMSGDAKPFAFLNSKF